MRRQHSADIERGRDALIGGVCSGLAHHFGFDVDVVRLVAVILCILSCGLLAVAYLVLWMMWPMEAESAATEGGSDDDVSAEIYSRVVLGVTPDEEEDDGRADRWQPSTVAALLVGLVVLGLLLALLFSSIVVEFTLPAFWPLLLVMIGIARFVIPDGTGSRSMSFSVGIALVSFGMLALPVSLGILRLDYAGWLSATWYLPVAAVLLAVVGRVVDRPFVGVLAGIVFLVFIVVGGMLFLGAGPVDRLTLNAPFDTVIVLPNVDGTNASVAPKAPANPFDL